jgi:hypothetical protein
MSEFLCHREMGDAKRLSAFRFLLVLTITPSTYNDRGVTGLNREMQTVCGIASSAAGIGRRLRGFRKGGFGDDDDGQLVQL